VINPAPAVHLREGSNDYRSDGIAKDVDRDNEGAQERVGRFEVGQHLRNTGSKHRRS